MEDNPYVFISYSTKNQPEADAMRKLLNDAGIRTWMAPSDIPVGKKYAQVITQAIRRCTCCLLILSDDAQNSVWVPKEIERAVHYRKPIFPVQLDGAILNDEFELYISTDQIVAVNKIDRNAPEVKKLLDSIALQTGTGYAENEVSSFSRFIDRAFGGTLEEQLQFLGIRSIITFVGLVLCLSGPYIHPNAKVMIGLAVVLMWSWSIVKNYLFSIFDNIGDILFNPIAIIVLILVFQLVCCISGFIAIFGISRWIYLVVKYWSR